MSLLFSYAGRIGRAQYWIGVAVAFAALVLAFGLAGAAMSSTGTQAPVVLAIPLLILFAWIHSAVTIKRLRDAGWPLGVKILFGVAPLVWLGATLEFIEYIGVLIAAGLVALIVVPGLVPPKAQA